MIEDIGKLLTGEELADLKKIVVDGEGYLFDHEEIYDKLYTYFLNSGDMPYGTAKARTGDPGEWILETLEKSDLFKERQEVRGGILKHCGEYSCYFINDYELLSELVVCGTDASLDSVKEAMVFLAKKGMLDIETSGSGDNSVLIARITDAGKEELQTTRKERD